MAKNGQHTAAQSLGVSPAQRWGGWSATMRRLPKPVRRFFSRKVAFVAAAILVVFVTLGILGEIAAPYDPTKVDPAIRFADPSLAHPLGTDYLGRDIASRLIAGARTALMIGVAAVALGLVLGVPLGMLSGYLGGRLDTVLVAIVDGWSAFPNLLVILLIVSLVGVSPIIVFSAIGVTAVPTYARLARAQTLSVSASDFVVACDALGGSGTRKLFRHILPNIISPIVVIATLLLATAIVLEASLSFIGLGVPPPNPTWGQMLAEGQQTFRTSPWLALFPGLAIFLVVLAFNVAGDSLRDALDPRLR